MDRYIIKIINNSKQLDNKKVGCRLVIACAARIEDPQKNIHARTHGSSAHQKKRETGIRKQI